jgi:DNA-binding IclR family transcriptional regulator
MVNAGVMSNDGVAVTRAVCKALGILDCLSKRTAPVLTAEIARFCGISRPTPDRHPSSLAGYGCVSRDSNHDDRYRLSYKVLELSEGLLDGI